MNLTKKSRGNYNKKYYPLNRGKILVEKKTNTSFGKVQDSDIKPEDITFNNLINDKRYRISHDKIRLTSHAKQQAYLRMGIQSELEIRKLAARAKRNGILVNILTDENYMDYELSQEHYLWLIDKSGCRHPNSGYVYFYQAYFYIFCGNKYRTLKTIIYPGLPVEDNRPSSGNEVVDNFFNSFVDNKFHNINIRGKHNRKTTVIY